MTLKYHGEVVRNVIQRSYRSAASWAMRELVRDFEHGPSKFYTEHDLTSRLYALIQQRINYATQDDRNGQSHYLVHHEYPTSFKCSMPSKNPVFVPKEDHEDFSRGHYDLSILRPGFIRNCTYHEAKGQDFRTVIKLRDSFKDGQPIIVAFELMFNRDNLSDNASDKWIKFICQDRDKVEHSRKVNFVQHYAVLAFSSIDSGEQDRKIKEALKDLSEVIFVTPVGVKVDTIRWKSI